MGLQRCLSASLAMRLPIVGGAVAILLCFAVVTLVTVENGDAQLQAVEETVARPSPKVSPHVVTENEDMEEDAEDREDIEEAQQMANHEPIEPPSPRPHKQGKPVKKSVQREQWRELEERKETHAAKWHPTKKLEQQKWGAEGVNVEDNDPVKAAATLHIRRSALSRLPKVGKQLDTPRSTPSHTRAKKTSPYNKIIVGHHHFAKPHKFRGIPVKRGVQNEQYREMEERKETHSTEWHPKKQLKGEHWSALGATVEENERGIDKKAKSRHSHLAQSVKHTAFNRKVRAKLRAETNPAPRDRSERAPTNVVPRHHKKPFRVSHTESGLLKQLSKLSAEEGDLSSRRKHGDRRARDPRARGKDVEEDEQMAQQMRGMQMDEEYPRSRHEPPLVPLTFKDPPSRSRLNTVTKKPERMYTFELRQEHMTLYKSARNAKKSTPIFNQWPARRSGQPKDMFCMTRQYDISKLPRAQIIEFSPLITRVKGITFDDSIVHHIDVFLCTNEIKKYPVVTKDIPSMTYDSGCDAMPWAYDRDGWKLKLPDHVGFTLGKGTPYKRLAVEWHYLLARDGVKGLRNIHERFTDHSGLRLVMTPDLRPHSAGVLGLMGGYMNLPPGKRAFKYSSTTGHGQVDKILQHDLRKFGKLKPVAVHLHMHNHGRAVWWDHLRKGKKVGEYGRMNHYKGFGVDQSFFMVDRKGDRDPGATKRQRKAAHFKWGKSGRNNHDSLKKGDRLRISCVFDTRCKYATPIGDPHCEKATQPIGYGLSHGQEMCGFLMMYYPHDPTVRYKRGMILGYERGELIPEDPAMDLPEGETAGMMM